MDIALPDTVSPALLTEARGAVDALDVLAAANALPDGLDPAQTRALVAVMRAVMDAAAEDQTDLSPSEVARRLRMARPTVMRLIARGELLSRKDGGHYVVSPRDLRAFRTRLTAIRRDALGGLTAMAEEYGF